MGSAPCPDRGTTPGSPTRERVPRGRAAGAVRQSRPGPIQRPRACPSFTGAQPAHPGDAAMAPSRALALQPRDARVVAETLEQLVAPDYVATCCGGSRA